MAGLGDTVELDVLNTIFRGTAWPHPAADRMSLHTGDPGEAGANEVVGGSYARKTVTFLAASAGAIALSASVDYEGMPAVTVTHVGFWTALGQYVAGAAITNRTLLAGDTYRVNSGTQITVD